MLKLNFKHGYLTSIQNPNGRKPAVYVVQPVTGSRGQRLKAKWAAQLTTAPYKRVAYAQKGTDVEFMKKLAVAGHKEVRFLD